MPGGSSSRQSVRSAAAPKTAPSISRLQPAPKSPTSIAPAPSHRRKLSLPPPITLTEMARDIFLHYCRRYVLLAPEVKLLVYTAVVLCGSLAHDFLPLPEISLSQKSNALNVYFVKFSWAWTLILLGPFIYCTAKVYSAGDNMNIARHLSRLAVSTAVWFFVCSQFFHHVGQTYGLCTKTAHGHSHDACVRSGGGWTPFDLSGHIFLLGYICLLQSEEGFVFDGWVRIKQLVNRCELDGTPPAGLANMRQAEIDEVGRDYEFYTPLIRWNFILIALANLIWDLCFIITAFYYHTFVQKFLAYVLAVACWFVTYRLWYRTPLSPGMPGAGRVRYMLNR